MSSALYALGRWAFRAHRRMLLLWVIVLAVLFTGAGLLSEGTDNTFSIPGTESQEALDALARTFPQVSGTSAQLIAVAPDGGDVNDADFEAAVTAAATDIAGIPQVSSATAPYPSDSSSGSSANISADDSAVIVPIQLSVATTAVLPSTADALQAAGVALEAELPAGSQVSVGGQLFAQTSTGISVTELLGIAVAYVVLFITFGSLVAAGLPLITALLGVGASLAIVFMATSVLTITSTTPLLALMLGLAVGIDYALFIISRHQDQLKHGIEPEESAARSVATSGSAVVFAALTVIIALLGLAVAGIPFLTIMGVAAALAVAIAVLMSVTLTPALLGFAGWHIVARRFRPGAGPPAAASEDGAGEDGAGEDSEFEDSAESEDVAPAEAEPAEAELTEAGPAETPTDAPPRGGFFLGWVHAVTRWPLVTVVAVVVLLGLAAIPAAGLRLALPDAGSLDEGTPGRTTYDLVAEHFGPGFNGPLIVTGSIIQSTDPVTLMDDLGAEIATVAGVASVPLATPNETGDTGIVQVIPEGAPDSEQTEELVATLRSMQPHFEEEYGVRLSVTGYTAAGIDISERLAGALLPFGLLVVGLSLVLLAMVFRSIVVPVTAALGYALSIGAAFGLTSLVFIDGFLADPLNVAGLGSVISFMPIILMGVLFGLAMDYEVFLVSRMREEYLHSDDPTGSVHRGFTASARVVTAAALIMFAVFAAFVPEGEANIQPIAFGLAVGVLIDAFLVRMTLIPAVLVSFGRGAWWIPGWLDRALPHFDVEGEGLAAEFALADWPEPGVEFAIAAEGMRVAGQPPDGPACDLMLAPGEALVLLGGSLDERSAILLAIGGRMPVSAGRVKVEGFVLPTRAAAVRARTAYVLLDASLRGVSAVHDALRRRPGIVLIDAADSFVDPELRAGIRRALGEARKGSGRRAVAPLTIVLACQNGAIADALLPLGVELRTVQLTDTPAQSAVAVR
ncbi:RND superfamily putative drug exporter [Microterricola gilva]|uniref:RND superfamily putative drug exporter n=1 Tax=Microterricola gilva TaxID=393267 RepID=A0A4Q8AQU4_9MICO|nr:MMPL family transporter [Microterricola gilva]RZU66409.1 RND superfamily putative drug exporter [Microterricola gilva]